MLVRFTNNTLLALVLLLTLTGLYGLVWALQGWAFELHRAAGWALIALMPWKAIISLRSLGRGLSPTFDRGALKIISTLLGAATLLVVGLGLMWAWRVGPDHLRLGGYADSVISWHWMLALGLLPPFALHAWRRWPRARKTDFLSRRGALKLMGLGTAGVVGWWMAGRLVGLRASPDAPRRITGSREQGSFTGNAFPVTHSLGEGRITLEAGAWRLALKGQVGAPRAWTYAEMLALPATHKVATLDCTTGWYSTQLWRGVPLSELLARAGPQAPASAVRLRAASGYALDFSLVEAHEILLATHVGGEVLNHWHGFPLRAVVPARRGWFWVKWLTEIEVLPRPHAAAPAAASPPQA